jgi:hypothetical protein
MQNIDECAVFDLIETGDSILVCLDDMPQFRIALSDKRVILVSNMENYNHLDLLDDMPDHVEDIEVNFRRDGHLRPVRQIFAETEIEQAIVTPRVWRATGKNLDPLAEAQRDEILEMIVASWAAHPNQTNQETAEESHRIASTIFGDDTSVNVMRVAGVRAAHTRGAYDHSLLEHLEARRVNVRTTTR